MRAPSTPIVRVVALAFAVVLAAPQSAAALDVGPWAAVLRAHARGGAMDYAALASDQDARAKLARFLEEVAQMPEDAPLGAWIDAYNALVVASVLERYPIASVKDVPGFFDRARHRVAGADRTLDDLENRVIRPRFRDARVHFALHCAAVGCPALDARPFAGDPRLDRRLDARVRAALGEPRILARRDGGGVAVSAIFTWYRDDFVRAAGSVRAWIERAGGRAVGALPPDDALGELPYEWALPAPP